MYFQNIALLSGSDSKEGDCKPGCVQDDPRIAPQRTYTYSTESLRAVTDDSFHERSCLLDSSNDDESSSQSGYGTSSANGECEHGQRKSDSCTASSTSRRLRMANTTT